MNEEDDFIFTIEPLDEKYTPSKVEELSELEMEEYYQERYYLENYET